jgi:DNA repair protein RecO (recombination protein O)
METLHPAFVLHARDFRDTSLLVELFTPEAGRIGLVARGVRSQRRGASRRALLQPLVPLWVDWGGRGELKNLQQIEPRAAMVALQGPALFSVLYLNELLCRLLPRDDPHPELFTDYEAALAALASAVPVELPLRRFELRLLESLGYGVSLQVDADGNALAADGWYRFDAGAGLRRLPAAAEGALAGRDLLAFDADPGQCDAAARRTLKRLCRQALQPHLGDRPLKSRQLFRL